MPRHVLVWARSRFLGPGATLPWALLVTLCALVVAVAVRGPSPGSPAPTRVAIRVACPDPTACARAASVAIDVWSEHEGPGLPLDIVVTDDALAGLQAAGLSWQVLVPDIDAEARVERARLTSPAAARPTDWFADYRDYRAISAYLEQLVAVAPDRAALHGIGSTLDGRTIWALRIGGSAPDATPMLINGTQHAREWISAMVSTCVADRLVRGYDRDPAIRDFVDHTELWVVPVVNPDGYQYSWAQDRYWRKNRRGGHGVDLNRNFGVAWGGNGSSGFKRSDVYRGEHAFSERETAALRDLTMREGIALHIDFHAYGQLVLYPWGWSATPTKDRDRFAAIGDQMASAIFAQHQSRYQLMSAVELYAASGTMSDWVYGEAEALSYTIELRPKGRGGFVLPPSEIEPTCDEGFAAVLALRGALR